MFRRIASLMKTLTHGNRFHSELDEEMAFHIDRLTDDLIRSGMAPREAKREARLRFGSTERVKTRSREDRGAAFFDEVGRNLRFSLRSMARRPLLTVTFVLTLGLCVGASTAVFSVVDSILWKSLPYPEPDRLALAVSYDPEVGIQPGMSAVDGTDWERIRDGGEPLQRAVFSDWPAGVNLSSDEGAAFVQQQRIGAGFFGVLGVPPFMGREFDPAEDVPGGPPIVILSYALWDQTFRRNPDILGTAIRLKGEEHTVVGVMPQSFRSHVEADVWTPLQPSPTSGEGGGTNYRVLIRVPEAGGWEVAAARIGGIVAEASEEAGAPTRRFGLLPFDQALTAGVRTPLLLLFGAVLLMLLVGCANLAGLQVARSLARRPEIATRQALGGGAGSLSRQMLTENLLLGILGGATGLVTAYLALGGLAEVVGTQFDTWQTLGMDRRALVASLGFTGLAMVLFGLAPVLQVRRLDLRGILVGGYRGVVGGPGHRLRKGLLIGQVAMVTALLFSAGLLVRSYGHLESLDPGFDAEGVLTVQLSLDDARFAAGGEVSNFFQETLVGIQRVPGVTSAAVALTLPYERPLNLPFQIPGVDEEGDYRIANVVYVTPGFMETLGIPILSGRDLSDGDGPEASLVVLANRAFVEANLGQEQPIGTRLSFGGGGELEVVGVVGNVQQAGAGWGNGGPVWASPTIYIPAAQAGDQFFNNVHLWFSPSWLVKGRGNPSEWAPQVTQAFSNVNMDMPVARVAPLEEIVDQALASSRLSATFLVMVAGFALALAIVGLYGIIANEVAERTKEMGLRMALGATPRGAIQTVGMSGIRLVSWGLGVGTLLCAGVSRIIDHVIWGVTPYDPPTIVVALAAMAALGAAASFLPASRLARLDPSQILQEN